MQLEMAKLEDSKQRTQAEMVMEQQKLQAQAQADSQKAQIDAMLKEQQLALEKYKAELAAQTQKEIEVMKMASDAELERMRLATQHQNAMHQLQAGQQHEIRVNGTKDNINQQVTQAFQAIMQAIEASKTAAIVPVRDAAGRIVGGRIQTAGGEVRDVRIQ